MTGQVDIVNLRLSLGLRYLFARSLFSVAAVIIAFPAFAEPLPLPPALLYKGKPILPICFHELTYGEGRDSLDLRQCDESKISIQERGEDSYGYGFEYKDGVSGNRPFVYYNYIGEYKGLPLVQITQGGGGTGQFTSLETIKRDGDRISVADYYGGGDRCNGGLGEVAIVDGALVMEQAVTPAALMRLMDAKLKADSKLYEKLYDCARCCVGSVRTKDDVVIDFSPDVTESSSDHLAYQACFDQLVRDEPGTRWNRAQLDKFAKKFNARCVERQS